MSGEDEDSCGAKSSALPGALGCSQHFGGRRGCSWGVGLKLSLSVPTASRAAPCLAGCHAGVTVMGPVPGCSPSQNAGMLWVERDLKSHPIPPLPVLVAPELMQLCRSGLTSAAANFPISFQTWLLPSQVPWGGQEVPPTLPKAVAGEGRAASPPAARKGGHLRQGKCRIPVLSSPGRRRAGAKPSEPLPGAAGPGAGTGRVRGFGRALELPRLPQLMLSSRNPYLG